MVGSSVSPVVKGPPDARLVPEEPAHFNALYREKNGRDDDFNRLVTAFRHRDHYEREMERIYRARPDLLVRKLADAEREEDEDEEVEEEEEDDDLCDHDACDLLEYDSNGDPTSGPVDTDIRIQLEGSLVASSWNFINLNSRATDLIKSSGMQTDEIMAAVDKYYLPLPLTATPGMHPMRQLYMTPDHPKIAAHLEQPVILPDTNISIENERAEATPQCTKYSSESQEQHLRVHGSESSHSPQSKGLLPNAGVEMPRHIEQSDDELPQTPADYSSTNRDFSDTTSWSCTDSIGSSPCGELQWLTQHSHLGLVGGSSDSFYFESEALAVKKLVDCYYNRQQGSGGASSGHSTQRLHTSGSQSVEESTSRKRTYEETLLSSVNDDACPAIGKRRKQVFTGQPRLACHFQKHDPERYPACGIRTSGFDTIAHVKQHLRRNHERNPNYCPRCKALFVTEADKNSHILSAFTSPCPDNASSLPEGLSPEMIKALGRRVGKDNDLYEQWFSVWDMIFPGVPRPQTCTFDLSGDVHVQVLALCSFFEAEGPDIVASVLREQGLAVGADGGEQSVEIESLTHRALSRAFHQVFEAWRSRRSQPGDASTSLDNSSTIGSSALDFDPNTALPRTPAAPSPAPGWNHDESFVEFLAGFEQGLPLVVEDVPVGVSGNTGTTERSIVLGEANRGEGLEHLPASIYHSDLLISTGLEKLGEKSNVLPGSDIQNPWPEWSNQPKNY